MQVFFFFLQVQVQAKLLTELGKHQACLLIKYNLLNCFNTLRPRTMDAIFQTTFSNVFSSMKMYEFLLKFH